MNYQINHDGSVDMHFSAREYGEVLIILHSLMHRPEYDKIALAEAIAIFEGYQLSKSQN